MIPFFRKIRNQPAGEAGKMADDNKPAQYMRYAVGEIALVVIGILIALQINNWNDDRKDKKSERAYLLNIKNDLLRDVASLEDHIINRKEKVNAARNILKLMDSNNSFDLIKLNEDFNMMVLIGYFKPNNVTIEELINSGNVNIISNDSIKNQLLNLEFAYKSNLESIDHENFDYEEYISKPYFNSIDFYPSFKILIDGEDKKKVNHEYSDYKSLLENKTFKNGCVNQLWMSLAFINSYTKISDQSKLIIKLIDQELEK